MDRSERRARLARAGDNTLNLEASDIELDLLTDARLDLESLDADAPAIDLRAAARALYGPFEYVFATKGRAAERALAAALPKDGDTIVTNSLFRTTDQSFKQTGFKTEIGAFASKGSADLELAWLEARLAKGGVAAVSLEPCNNQVAGWPVTPAHARAVRALCDRFSARLLVDATRLFANLAGHDFLALADAFTVSCAKEGWSAVGGIIGAKDPALAARAFDHCFEQGTWLETPALVQHLARGLTRAARGVEGAVTARRRALETVATALGSAGITTLEPLGGHALYVIVENVTDPLHARALEAHLFEISGVRARIAPNAFANRHVMRVTWPLDRYDLHDLARVPDALIMLFQNFDDAPKLVARAGQASGSLFVQYDRESTGR